MVELHIESQVLDGHRAPRPGTYVKVGSSFRAMVRALSSGERRRHAASGVEGDIAYRVTVRAELPDGVELGHGARLVWTSHPKGTRTLEIKGPPRELHADAAPGPMGAYLEVLCEELDAPALGAPQAASGSGGA